MAQCLHETKAKHAFLLCTAFFWWLLVVVGAAWQPKELGAVLIVAWEISETAYISQGWIYPDCEYIWIYPALPVLCWCVTSSKFESHVLGQAPQHLLVWVSWLHSMNPPVFVASGHDEIMYFVVLSPLWPLLLLSPQGRGWQRTRHTYES